MYSSLMGIFDFPTPISQINAISSSKEPSRREFFRTHYFSDPWPLPSSTTKLDEGKVGGMEFPMSVAKIAYQSIVNTVDFDPTPFSPRGDGWGCGSSLDSRFDFYSGLLR